MLKCHLHVMPRRGACMFTWTISLIKHLLVIKSREKRAGYYMFPFEVKIYFIMKIFILRKRKKLDA